MKIYLLLVCFLISISFYSCQKENISISRINSIEVNSVYTKSNYTVWIIVPEDYNPNLKYESLYLLDADASYLKADKIAKLADAQSKIHKKQNLIIIGISSANDRSRDFTPTKTDLGEGGSANYVKFISEELFPLVESKYSVQKTAQSRVILGHSLGGLLVGYFFTLHPNIFNNYIMLSPSLWYDKHIFFEYEKNTRMVNYLNTGTVFVASGQLEETTVIEAIEFNFRLEAHYNKFRHKLIILKNRSHISSAFENAETGIAFYFENK